MDIQKIQQYKTAFDQIAKTVKEIGKQLGMKPEEIFRLSGFTREEFLNMMTKDGDIYSNAKIIVKV